MKIHAPYSLAAAAVAIVAIGVGVLHRPAGGHVQLVDPPLILSEPVRAPAVVGARGNAEPSAPVEGSAADSGVGTLPTLEDRARAGDARAQWTFGSELRRCWGQLKLDEMGEPLAYPHIKGCEPYRGRPVREWQEWQAKALAAGDPVALLYDALASEDPEQFNAAAAVAAASGDPEAQMTLGHLMMAQENADGSDAYAWMMFACDDCTLDDPRLGFEACVDSGECVGSLRLSEWIASMHGEAVAQDIQSRVASLRLVYP